MKSEESSGLVAPPVVSNFDRHFVRNRDVMLRFLEGQSIEDIAKAKQIPPEQVKKILQRAPVKAEIARLAGLANDRYLKERVDSLTIEALDVVRDTMRGVSTSELRFKAAKSLLDASPLLKEKDAGELAGEMGRGLGEAIITRLAQLEAEKARAQQEAAQTIEVNPDGASDPSAFVSDSE